MIITILIDGHKHTGPNTWAAGLIASLARADCTVIELNAASPATLLRLPQLLRADVVHGYHISGVSVVLLALAKLARRRVVFTLHGNYLAEAGDKTGLKRIFWTPFFRLSLRLADAITLSSNYLRHQIESDLPAAKEIIVIPNAIDQPHVPAPAPSGPVHHLLEVTQFSLVQKASGVIPLTAAVAELAGEGSDISLKIIGGGPLLDDIQGQTPTTAAVAFLGRRDHDQVMAQMQACDLFIHSTYLDNLPYAVLEAVSLGKPVIASRVGGLVEVLDDSSLVEVDKDAIKNRLQTFITDESFRQKSIRANNLRLTNYLWPAVSQKFIALYEHATPPAEESPTMTATSQLKGTIYLTIASLAFIISGYLTNILLGRLLAPAAYGTYGAFISLITTINVMQVFGLPQAVSKFAAEQTTDSDGILATGLRLQFMSTLAIGAAFFVFAPVIATVFRDDTLAGYARLVALVFPLYGAFALYGGYHNGRHNFRRQALMNIVYSAAKLSLVVGLAVVRGLGGAIMGFVVAPAIALVVGFVAPKKAKQFPARPMIIYALPLISFAVFATLQLSIDLFILKAMVADAKLAGYYTAAQNIALIPYFGMSAIGQVLFPSISHLIGRGDHAEARRIVGQSLRYMLMIIIPLATLMAATAPGLTALLYGHAYAAAVGPLRILLAGYVLLAITAMLANVLSGAGRARTSMIIVVVGALVSALGCLILIPHYGSLGAASATLLGAAATAVYALVATYRLLPFAVDYVGLAKVLGGSALVLAVGWLGSRAVALLPLVYLVAAIFYLMSLHLVGEITREDRSHIKSLLPSWIPFTRWL